ncbi:MAG: PorV/PorQ family protein [Gemmatimonadales bacterium]|jgi:hypothetical protein
MRRSRSSARLIALVLGGAGLVGAGAARPLRAQAITQAQGAEFLLLPVGARATALGQAATADGGTTEAIFWNPAGLAAIPRAEFAVHHYDAFFGTGDAVALAAHSASLGTIAVAAYLVNYGDLDLTAREGSGVPIGRISPRNVALSVSYATEVGSGVDVGVTYKLVQFRVDCSGDCTDVPASIATTHAVDVGARFSPAGLPFVVGASLRNIGFPLQVNNSAQADPLPARFSVGVAYMLVRPVSPRPEEHFDVRVLADVQGALRRGQEAPVALVGLESGVGDLIRIRGGYAFLDSDAKGPSLGVGIKIGGMSLDLARVFFANDIGEQEPFHVSFRAEF